MNTRFTLSAKTRYGEVMDPYIERTLGNLGERDPIQVLETTPARLEGFLVGFFESDWERSYEKGKWSAQQILAHLADVELGLGFRFRQAVAEENYRPESFDQDVWTTRYTRLEPALALGTFRAIRAWNLALFATFDLNDWLRPVRYPFEGIDSVDGMVRFLAGHDLNHLGQLESIARAVQEGDSSRG